MAAKKKTSQSGKRAAAKTARTPSKKLPAKTSAAKKTKRSGKKASPVKGTAKKRVVKKASAKKPQKKAAARKTASKLPPKKVPVKKAVAARAVKKAPKLQAEAQKRKLAAALAKKAQLDKQKEKVRAQKEREQLLKAKEKERVLASKEQERLRKEKDKEKERLKKEKERALALKEQERLHREKDKERERERLLKEKEKERLKKEAERLRKEKDKEKERLKKEKEKERLDAQKKREEERLRKEKEREAYRKAREAERERVRSEKEAARRALEGRVARQARQQQRIAGTSRGTSARVYRPDAIPSQSGTTREHLASPPRSSNLRSSHQRQPVRPAVPPSASKPRPPEALDERWALIQKRLGNMPERFQREYAESFDMSWIHHDSALEGVVYTFQELKTAVDPNIVIVPDSSLQPVCEEIRRHKLAIDWVRELGRDDTPLSADTLKKIYIQLHPEEGDLKSVKYRKEIPQHRLYFHEYAPPDKIAVRVRQAFDWLHGPEPDKLKDPIRVAARLHYDLLRTFPFPQDSGKVARMLMNILLLRANLPPVIVHSTERQRYYDALRGSLPTIVQMVNDSVKNALVSIEKVLDEEEDKVASQATGS